MQRAVKVEALFSGVTWTDISDKAKLADGVGITRGRESEVDDDVAVGTFSLQLDNSDGRFSPELTGSPYYPNVVQGVPVRVSVNVGGTWKVRAYGTVQAWPTTPLSWTVAECVVTVNDSLGTFPSYTFRQAADEIVRRCPGLLYHWPLRDSDVPLVALAGSALLTTNGAAGLDLGAALLPMEEGDGHHPRFVSGSGGLTLTSRVTLEVPWRVRLIIMSEPTDDCELIELTLPGVASRTLVRWYTATGFDSGAALGFPPSWPAVVEMGSDGSFWRLRVGGVAGSVATAYAGARPTKIVVNPTLSGGAVWSSAHLMVLSGTSDATALNAFTQQINSPRLTTYATAPEAVASLSGGLSISGVPSSQIMLPPLEGRDPADVIASMLKGMGARLVDDLDGTLTWLPFPPSGTPVVMPGSAGDLSWGTDTRGWLSDCTVTWPDGTSYTATRPDGERKSDSIDPVHASANGDIGMADWLVHSPTRARLPVVTYNLSAMSNATVATLMAITVGTRIQFNTLPAWIPSPQICIVEGVDEDISNDAWSISFKLSPDVYSRLFILGDPVQGVLDGTYLLAP